MERLRTYLGGQIPQCESVELRDELREIQAALRQCLTDYAQGQGVARAYAEREGISPVRYGVAFEAQALGVMRARVGAAVAEIAGTFDIPVDGDLARIVPQGLDEAEAEADGEPRSLYEGLQEVPDWVGPPGSRGPRSG
jgi:hypothetical protein